MKNIVIYDTSIASENGGDRIIMDYCLKALRPLQKEAFFTHLPTHDTIGKVGRKKLKNSDLSIVCGTNLLTSHALKYRQWRYRFLDLFSIKNLQLMGVGWWQYQDDPDLFTRWIYKKVLGNGRLHSVRDKYTEEKLRKLGLNVIYTACPTMWGLTEEHCSQIKKEKAANVVTTLTDYKKDKELDKKLFEILHANYEKVYFWVQSFDDYKALKMLGELDKVIIIGPGLEEYDFVMENMDIDYVGTRLHGGIRALNHKRRTIIIACDNRAIEIGKDTGLPVIERKNIITQLDNMIKEQFATKIELPLENIEKWKISVFKEIGQ